MMNKRLTLAALFVLSPAVSNAVDVASMRSEVVNTVNELQNSVLPAVLKAAQAIKDKEWSVVENYLSDSNQPLIPIEALQFAGNNIGAVQQALVKALEIKIPKEAVSELNNIQAHLGDNLQELKSKAANALQKVDLNQTFNAFSNAVGKISIGDAKKFVAGLKKINPDKLIASAKALRGTLVSLRDAAQNLQAAGAIDTLNDLSNDLPRYISDKASREDLIDPLLGLLTDLNAQLPTITPFINAFASFAKEFVGFTNQLYNIFGPAIWAQAPESAQNTAKNALDRLRSNEGKLMNAIETAREKISNLIQ